MEIDLQGGRRGGGGGGGGRTVCIQIIMYGMKRYSKRESSQWQLDMTGYD